MTKSEKRAKAQEQIKRRNEIKRKKGWKPTQEIIEEKEKENKMLMHILENGLFGKKEEKDPHTEWNNYIDNMALELGL